MEGGLNPGVFGGESFKVLKEPDGPGILLSQLCLEISNHLLLLGDAEGELGPLNLSCMKRGKRQSESKLGPRDFLFISFFPNLSAQ